MGRKKRTPKTVVSGSFENLKEALERKGIKVAWPAPQPKQESAPDDEELFNEAMSKVREIKEFREIPVRKKRVAPPRQCPTDREALDALRDVVQGSTPLHLPDTQEYVEWVNPLYVHKKGILPKLHQGKFSVQDQLDLHGLIREDAGRAFETFLQDSLRKGYRCIKVIHGRGLRSPKGPVLKSALVAMLTGRFRKQVIAFVTARQCDGGLGALYVLLHS